METKNINLQRLKRSDPQGYAELCEVSGYKGEALRYYARQNNDDDLFHAAELAIDLKKYHLAKKYLSKALEASDESLRWSKNDANSASMDPEGRGLMGAAMGFWNSQDKNRDLRIKVSRLEAKIPR